MALIITSPIYKRNRSWKKLKEKKNIKVFIMDWIKCYLPRLTVKKQFKFNEFKIYSRFGIWRPKSKRCITKKINCNRNFCWSGKWYLEQIFYIGKWL